MGVQMPVVFVLAAAGCFRREPNPFARVSMQDSLFVRETEQDPEY
jgi:hypothetical protein